MKQVRLRIIDLLDQHGDTFEKCKGCPICNEIMQLRKKLERSPAEKYRHILAKGEDIKRSELELLIENGVNGKVICRALGMSLTGYWDLIQNLGLGKKGMWMSKLTREMYQDFKAQGLTDHQIAEKAGIHQKYVYQLKVKWGLTEKKSRTAAEIQVETNMLQPKKKVNQPNMSV